MLDDIIIAFQKFNFYAHKCLKTYLTKIVGGNVDAPTIGWVDQDVLEYRSNHDLWMTGYPYSGTKNSKHIIDDEEQKPSPTERITYEVSDEELERYGKIKYPPEMSKGQYIGYLLDKGDRFLNHEKSELFKSLEPAIKLALDPTDPNPHRTEKTNAHKVFYDGSKDHQVSRTGPYGFETERKHPGLHYVIQFLCQKNDPPMQYNVVESANGISLKKLRYTEKEWEPILEKAGEIMREMYSNQKEELENRQNYKSKIIRKSE